MVHIQNCAGNFSISLQKGLPAALPSLYRRDAHILGRSKLEYVNQLVMMQGQGPKLPQPEPQERERVSRNMPGSI